jgi:hypothetical protein
MANPKANARKFAILERSFITFYGKKPDNNLKERDDGEQDN